MVASLFYTDEIPVAGATAVLGGDSGFHAATVRRIRVGESLMLGDGAGTLADCVVESVDRDSLGARVLKRRTVAPTRPTVTVAQAIPKSERSELAIELATEAGADEFLAWQAARCVGRWDDDQRAAKGLRRWRAVAHSAAQQARRAYLPGISGPVATRALAEAVAERTAAGSVALLLHESAERPLTAVGLSGATSILIVVGPEGGVTEEEKALLEDAGAVAVQLGPTVLRTSTAAAVALGALGALTPRWEID
ncbi:MAG: 16S rRNA (uracil(1498)-N(3))-methyltransferase [Mycobacteriaceae bacterium]|nr:16S rRNA (uracil(1498)-N(3))-methyltransferase [Mycobacteriaceae bacterium]